MTSREFLSELFVREDEEREDEDVDAARVSANDGPMPSTWKLYGRAPGRTGNAGT